MLVMLLAMLAGLVLWLTRDNAMQPDSKITPWLALLRSDRVPSPGRGPAQPGAMG